VGGGHQNELTSLESTGTCTIADLPQGCKPATAKWVFKTKRNAHRAITKYKDGVDYHKTFLPVVSMTSLCTVLCYSLKIGHCIRPALSTGQHCAQTGIKMMRATKIMDALSTDR
jgi:hypothetical protein